MKKQFMKRTTKEVSEPMDKNKTIAFCGTRGLPANYGGFETAVDEITQRFIDEGYECDVFCRASNNSEKVQTHEGRNLIYVKGSNSRKLDTFVSSIQTGLYILKNRKKYDYLFWFNNANFLGIFLTLFSGIPMSINTDGLEWRRDKWSAPFKAYYVISSFLISLFCKNLISDSISIQSYYRKKFLKKTIFIPYGSPTIEKVDKEKENSILKDIGLEKGKYYLQITRFEPDNLPLAILEGFCNSSLPDKGFKMVLIGYKDATPYALQIKEMDGKQGVVVCNAIYDKEILSTLRKYCFSYVHGNSVGGTNPALLEAMASCSRIMAIEGPFSREVLGNDLGIYFNRENLSEVFNKSLETPDQRNQMGKRVQLKYSWDEVALSYMNLAEGKEANYIPAKYW